MLSRKKILLIGIFLLFKSPAQSKEARPQELPHYFPPGVIQSTDSLKQLTEYSRYLTATRKKLNDWGPLTPGNDSIVIETDIESTSSALNVDKPTKMKLVLDHYVQLPDGRIRVTFTDSQEIIAKEQLSTVVKDLLQAVSEAADNDFTFYNWLIGPTDKINKLVAERVGVSERELNQILDREIPGYQHGITFRERFGLPRPMRRSDFIPRELHFGYAPPGVLGMAWLNTGIVYYTPQARILDYLMKKPIVMQHEMVHANINLEKFPLSEGFDVELMASIPAMLYLEDQVSLPFHGYLAVIRELMWIYTGFNFKQARKELFYYDLGRNLIPNESKFREYAPKMDLAKTEFLKFLRETAIPEFYSNLIWWNAMNEKRADQNSMFRILMAAHYNPTILGGEKNTMHWLETHREEILEMAKIAFEESGKPLMNSQTGTDFPPIIINQYRALFTDEEKEKISQYFSEHPEELERLFKMPVPEIINLLKKIKSGKNPKMR